MLAYLTGPGSSMPHTKRLRYWYRAHGPISEAGGLDVHLSALAYMSDNYFIGTVALVHEVSPFSGSSTDLSRQKAIDSDQVIKDSTTKTSPSERKASSFPSPLTSPDSKIPTSREAMESVSSIPPTTAAYQHQASSTIGMMVSLDHTIYFHRPREIRADDWLCSEMETPWAGAERGVVTQRIWNRHGRLVATCVQEVSRDFFLFNAHTVLQTDLLPGSRTIESKRERW